MAKISESKIALQPADFSASNALLMNGLKTLQEAPNPFIKAMENNFATRKDNAEGLLKQFVSTRDPSAPGFGEDFQNFFNQINAYGNGASQSAIADEVVARQKNIPTLAAMASQTKASDLANTNLENQGKANAAFNEFLITGDPAQLPEYFKQGADSTVNYATNPLNYTKEQAATTALNEQGIFNMFNLVGADGFAGQVFNDTASQEAARQSLVNGAAGGGGGGSVKKSNLQNSPSTPGSGGGVVSDTGSASRNIQQSLIGTESSGNSQAKYTSRKTGNNYGGLMQFGDARLKDYANKTKTKPMTALQFKQLPASEQQKVNDWHTEDLIKKAQATGAIGRTINGVPVTLGGLVAVAHIGGYTGMQKFVSTNGKYNPQDELKTSLTDYLRKHAGSEGGGTTGGGSYSGGGGAGAGPNYQTYQADTSGVAALGRGYNEANTKVVMDLAKQMIAGRSKGPFGMPEIRSIGSGSAIGEQTPQLLTDYYKRKSDLSSGATQANIASAQGALDTVQANQLAEQEYYLQETARLQAEAEGNVVSIDKVVDDVSGFKKALSVAGITPEMYASLPTDEQVPYLTAWQKYEVEKKKGVTEANSLVYTGGLSTKKTLSGKSGKKYSPLVNGINKALQKVNIDIDTELGDALHEENWLEAKLKYNNVTDNKNNMKNMNKKIASYITVELTGNNENSQKSKDFDNMISQDDLVNLISASRKLYIDTIKRNDGSRADIEGKRKFEDNPKLLEGITKTTLQSFVTRKRAKMAQDRAAAQGRSFGGFDNITNSLISKQ
jgi:hypothetical protein